MVEIGVVYDFLRLDEKLLLDELKKTDAKVKLFNSRNEYFDLSNAKDVSVDVFIQRSISYYRALHYTFILEKLMNARVVNSFYLTLVFGNKLFTSVLLSKNGIPNPKTFVSFENDSALDAMKKIGFPVVIKPVVGSWGRLVSLVNDLESAKSILEARELLYPIYQVYYIQEKVKKPNRDLRIVVVGSNPVAAEYRYAKDGDWRTNLSLGGKAERAEINNEIENVVKKVVGAFGEGVYGIDCMESERGLLVHEINHNVEFKGASEATGINIAKEIANYLISLAKR